MKKIIFVLFLLQITASNIYAAGKKNHNEDNNSALENTENLDEETVTSYDSNMENCLFVKDLLKDLLNDLNSLSINYEKNDIIENIIDLWNFSKDGTFFTEVIKNDTLINLLDDKINNLENNLENIKIIRCFINKLIRDLEDYLLANNSSSDEEIYDESSFAYLKITCDFCHQEKSLEIPNGSHHIVYSSSCPKCSKEREISVDYKNKDLSISNHKQKSWTERKDTSGHVNFHSNSRNVIDKSILIKDI